jgi:predicted SnoaL-like aldol condensation-catalyzing enzyme
MKLHATFLSALALLCGGAALAQAPVEAARDPEALFTDTDPQLHANKQVALRVMRELLQCNHWDEAERYMTERYIQHNPNVVSGRDAVVAFFSRTRQRTPTCEKLDAPVVAVLAEDDLVTVVWRMTCDEPSGSGTYTSTWFDMWRIRDGKVDEHWDPAIKTPTPCRVGE